MLSAFAAFAACVCVHRGLELTLSSLAFDRERYATIKSTLKSVDLATKTIDLICLGCKANAKIDRLAPSECGNHIVKMTDCLFKVRTCLTKL